MFCDVCANLAQGLSETMQAAALSTAMLASPMQDAPPSAAYVISNVTVIDVEKGEALPGRWVVVDDGVIQSISAKGELKFADDVTSIDGGGKFLIPGLFDAHVHLTAGVDTFGPMLVTHGVTCVRDLGAMTDVIIALREESRMPGAFAPEIVCTGAIIDGNPPVWPFSEPCDTPEESRAAVNKLHKAGVDQIKVYSLLKPEVHAAAIDEAHKLGLKAVGHVPDALTYDELIASGQDCVEHMQGLDKLILSLTDEGLQPEDLTDLWHSYRGYRQYDGVDKTKLRAGIKRMKDAGIAMCPTVVVMAGIARARDESVKNDPRMEFVPGSVRSFWDASQFSDAAAFNASLVPNLVKLVGDLHAEGVTLMVGTDLANAYVFPGSAVHEEMAFFAEAGVPAADILRAATIVPARFCGVDDRLGSIAPGKTASMVLLSANPLDDIAGASKIEGVFLRGAYFDRAALDEQQEHVREIVKGTATTYEAVALDLPGKVVFRGRYAQRFQDFDAGVEDFLVTQTDDGFHVMAHTQPQNNPQGPSLVTLHADTHRKLMSAEYATLTKAGMRAVYKRHDGAFDAVATKHDGSEEKQHFSVVDPLILSTPVTASDFLVMHALTLDVGASQDVELVSIGFPSWQMAKTPGKVTRSDDEIVTLPDGSDITAAVYELSFTTQYGPMTVRSWVHPAGLTIRSVLNMAFGEVESKLVELKTE